MTLVSSGGGTRRNLDYCGVMGLVSCSFHLSSIRAVISLYGWFAAGSGKTVLA